MAEVYEGERSKTRTSGARRACGHAGFSAHRRLAYVSDNRATEPAQELDDTLGDLGDLGAVAAVETLVGDWTTVPDIAERLDVSLARVRQFLADRDLLAFRTGPRRVVSIPAKFLGEQGPRPELKGTFTVLADGGMSDEQILRWLFTVDASLPVTGAPIDSLIAGHKTEIRRRAQATAF